MTQWWIVYCPGKKAARNRPNSHGSYAGTSVKVQIDHAYDLTKIYVLCRYMVAILFHIVPNGWKRGIVNGWDIMIFTTFHNYCSSTIIRYHRSRAES